MSQIVEYKEDQKHGSWMQYFENGDTMLIATYLEGKLHGEYLTFYPDAVLQSKGMFENDLKDGPWQYFTEEGEEKNTLFYKMGELENPEVLEESYEQFIKLIEENLDNIPDPANDL